MNMVHYIVYYIIFGVHIIPFKSGKKIKNCSQRKKYSSKRTQNSRSRMQSVNVNFHKLFITLFHIFETFYLSSFLWSISLKIFVSSYGKCNLKWWNNAPVIRHKWALLRAWWPIFFFIAYFETMLGRDHLQKAVSMESRITSKLNFVI